MATDTAAPAAAEEEEVRVEVVRGATWSTIGIFILLGGATVVLARGFLMPVLLAFLLSLTFSPVRRWMVKRGAPTGIVAALITFGLVVLVFAALLGLSGPIQTYAADAPAILNDIQAKLRGVSSAVEQISEASAEVEKLASAGEDGAERVVVGGPGLLERIAFSTPYLLAQFVLTLALLFFLIASGDMFYEKIVQASPTFRDKRRSVEIAYDIERKISRYFLTITVINAGLGISVALALWLIGMPNPILFGTMAFVFNFIPFVGAIVGVAITAAIGLVTFDQPATAALAAGTYLALTSIEGQFVTPYAVGRSLKLNPVVVFLAVAFWGWAWSVIGMFIAVPVLIAIRAFSEHVPALNGLGLFLSGRDEPLGGEENDRAAA